MSKRSWPERVYDEYNRKWFGGTLPKATVKWSRQPDKDWCIAWTVGDEILLNSRFKEWPAIWKFYLFHEMIHIKYPDATNCQKSRRFQREMLRLAREGAFKKLW